RAIADQARTIRIPVHMVDTLNQLARVSRALLEQLGREPNEEELAYGMGITVDKVQELKKISQQPVSLESPIGEEEDSHLGDFVEDKMAVAPLEAASEAMFRNEVEDILATLRLRERRVVQLRFGLVDVVPTRAVAYGRLTGQGAIDGMEQMADEKVEAGGPASSRRVEGARQAPCLDRSKNLSERGAIGDGSRFGTHRLGFRWKQLIFS